MIKIYIESINHEYATEEEKLDFLSFVYAHGNLEREAGFDLVSRLKNSSFDMRKNYDGEPIVAVLPNGKEVESLLWFWHSHYVSVYKGLLRSHRLVSIMPRGLVVGKTDKQAAKFAKKMFDKRSRWL